MTESTCIFGPPGTGKTRELVQIAEVEATNSNVLFMSFTKAAAQEAAQRAKSKRITASTLHSFAYKTLGLNRGSVVDEPKLNEFSALIGVPIKRRDEDQLQIGDEYFDVISFAANRLIDQGEAYEQFGRPGNPREFDRFASSYTKWKETFGYVDFDDMLEGLNSVSGDIGVPPVVILDEAQDSSPLQWMTFRKIISGSKRAFIAGDDDQAIYEWSGADPHGMIDFADDMKSKVRVLDQSHRMPPSVHQYVHDNILTQIEKRHAKKFEPRTLGVDAGLVHYGSTVDFDIDSVRGKDSLLLVRDKFRSMDIQRQLNASLIPYKIAGGYSVWDNIKAWAIRGFITLNSGGVPDHRMQHAIACVTGCDAGDYSMALGKNWRSAIPMTGAQWEFYEAAADQIMDPISVTLSTIHQAKGREADHVVINLELTDRVIENAIRNRDAELRVMYVACTRAKEKLSLCGENLLLMR